MAKNVLIFGDSNTYGTPPARDWGEGGRYDAQTRWPMVTATALGETWEVIAEGLPGRTATSLVDPVMGVHMNGQLGLQIALQSHGPLDVLVIMLGTNDCKTAFGLTADAITGHIAALLAIAQDPMMQNRHGGFQILLLCPPRILETGTYSRSMLGAEEKSAALPALYKALADHHQIGFFDTNTVIASSAVDGIHLTEDAHQGLGYAVAEKLRDLV